MRAIEEGDSEMNAVAVPRFERALGEAAAIDRLRAQGHPLGPLAGLPVTVKECFDLAGTPTTAGVARLRRQPSGLTSAPDHNRTESLARAPLGELSVQRGYGSLGSGGQQMPVHLVRDVDVPVPEEVG